MQGIVEDVVCFFSQNGTSVNVINDQDYEDHEEGGNSRQKYCMMG